MERIYIEKARMNMALRTLRREFEQDGRRMGLHLLDIVDARMRTIPPADLKDIERNIFTTDRFKRLEPIAGSDRIGIDKYHCGHCRALVGRRDSFCRSCGWKLEDDIDLNEEQ